MRGGLIGDEPARVLASARRFLWNLQCSGRLLTEKPLDMDSLGKGGQAFLLREVGVESLERLAAMLSETVEAAGAIIDAAMQAEVSDQKDGDQKNR